MPAFSRNLRLLALPLALGLLAACAGMAETTGDRKRRRAASRTAIGLLTGDFLSRTTRNAVAGVSSC